MTWALLAQSGVEQGWLIYLNYGVLGVTVLAFIFGKVIPGVLHERSLNDLKEQLADARREAGEKDVEIARLNSLIQDKVIPAIVRATDIQAQLVEQRLRAFGERERGAPSHGAD